MNLKKIHHVAIICSDYEKSRFFYHNILGLDIIKETYRKERDSYKLDLSVDGLYQIELFSFPNPPVRISYPEAAGLRHLAFEVDDLHRTIQELKSNDLKIEDIREDPITGKLFTFFNDPDGLPIELCEA